ncbi:MAG: RND family transporter [Hadesarchaea archaeon]|nr:RND family transporter [Hadesarchaea archaeon]
MLNKITESSRENPKLVIIIVSLITVFMVFGASQVSMSSELEKFLPQDYTSVKVTHKLENNIGGTTRERILVEGKNLTSGQSFRTLVDLKLGLENNPHLQNYIIQVQCYPNYLLSEIDNYENLSNTELESLIQEFLSQPEIKNQTDSLLSDNENATLFEIIINTQLSRSELNEKTELLHEYTQSFDENHDEVKLGNTGTLSTELETQEIMNRDNKILIPAAIIVIILILYLVFRRISDTSLPFLVLGLGAIWMIGLMGFLSIPFTMIYVALVPVILGIGIDYTIHMLNRYYEERGNNLSAGDATTRSVKTVGTAISLTAITTIIGFSSFGVSDMPPVRDFGLLAAAGVFFIFALATTLLPSLLSLRDQGKKSREQGESKSGDKIGAALSKIELGTFKHQKPVLLIAAVISIICIISSTGLTTTMSFNTFMPQNVSSIKNSQKVTNYFGGQDTIFVLVEGDIPHPLNIYQMYSLENSIISDSRNSQTELITGSQSIASFIWSRASENFSTENMPDFEELREKISLMIENLKKEYPTRINRLVPEENKAIIYFYAKAETDKDMKKATEIIRSNVENYSNSSLDMTLEGEPAVGGSPAIISDIMDSIIPSMRNSVLLAILLVGIVLALVFRSTIIGIIGTLPVSLALFWEFGALVGMGWSLDVMNMMVSALAIGIGVDFTIHITHRFQEEWRENEKTPEESISITIQSVGRAILAAAGTTIGVFLVISLSRMPAIARFGQLSAMVILFTLISALLVLPSALLAYAKWKEE